MSMTSNRCSQHCLLCSHKLVALFAVQIGQLHQALYQFLEHGMMAAFFPPALLAAIEQYDSAKMRASPVDQLSQQVADLAR